MKTKNLFLILIGTSNLILIICLSLLNSVLSPWGVFLYLPGLFLIPHYQLLDPYRNLFCLLLTGFLVDHFFNHTLGFHAFFFALISFVSKEFFHLGKQNFKQIIVYQWCMNLILAVAWYIFCDFGESLFSTWGFGRFCGDFFLSSLLLIPLSLWHSQFCDQIIYRFGSSSLPNFVPTK